MAAEGFPVGHQESRAFLAQYRHGFVYFVYFVVALSSVSAALRQATKVVCRTNTSPKLRNAALRFPADIGGFAADKGLAYNSTWFVL